MSILRTAAFSALLLLLSAALHVAPADVIVLNDGKKIEGEITDKGGTYEVKTRYGTLRVDKGEVKKIVRNPAEMVAQAETLRRLARDLYQEALPIEAPKERNRKLNAGVEILDRALKTIQEARETFPGPEYAHLDKASVDIVQEMRLFRDKMTADPAAAPAAAPPAVVPPPPDAPAPVIAKPPDPARADAAKEVAPGADLAAPVAPSKRDRREAAEVAASPTVLAPDAMTPAVPRTPKELLGDLSSADPAVRKAAADGLAKAPAPEHLAPLAETLKQEANNRVLDALELALLKHDAAALLKLEAVKGVAASGTPERKAVVVRVLKRLGGDAALRFLVDQFVLKGDDDSRNEVASALKRHKAAAVKLLTDAFRKAAGKTDIQVSVIQYVGILGESAQGTRFLASLLEVEEIRPCVLHAILKIDRPAIPVLLQVGLGGPTKTRNWSAQLLRYFTNTPPTSRSMDELARWWTANRRDVEAEEAAWDKQDEQLNWPVDERDWREYELPILDRDGNELHLGHYRTTRGRPRQPMMDATTGATLEAARQEARQKHRDEKDRARAAAAEAHAPPAGTPPASHGDTPAVPGK